MGIDKQTDGCLCRCDGRMLRYMAGVRRQDGRSSSEVAEMCGVDDLSVKLRQRRLRWLEHVKRAERGVLVEVGEVRVGGQQPEEKPWKKWEECVMEDMNLLGVEEHVAQDRQMWKAIIACPAPS